MHWDPVLSRTKVQKSSPRLHAPQDWSASADELSLPSSTLRSPDDAEGLTTQRDSRRRAFLGQRRDIHREGFKGDTGGVRAPTRVSEDRVTVTGPVRSRREREVCWTWEGFLPGLETVPRQWGTGQVSRGLPGPRLVGGRVPWVVRAQCRGNLYGEQKS